MNGSMDVDGHDDSSFPQIIHNFPHNNKWFSMNLQFIGLQDTTKLRGVSSADSYTINLLVICIYCEIRWDRFWFKGILLGFQFQHSAQKCN